MSFEEIDCYARTIGGNYLLNHAHAEALLQAQSYFNEDFRTHTIPFPLTIWRKVIGHKSLQASPVLVPNVQKKCWSLELIRTNKFYPFFETTRFVRQC